MNAREALAELLGAIDVFERKERGIPQAHLAAELVAEMRAALVAGEAAAGGHDGDVAQWALRRIPPVVSSLEWRAAVNRVYRAARGDAYLQSIPSELLDAMRDVLLAVGPRT